MLNCKNLHDLKVKAQEHETNMRQMYWSTTRQWVDVRTKVSIHADMDTTVDHLELILVVILAFLN